MNKKNDDLLLVNNVQQQQCESSLKELIERHSGLFYSVSHKFKSNLNLSEIHLDKDFVIYKSVLSFNPNKGAKFSTWLGNMTKYYCLNVGKKEFKYANMKEEELSFFLDARSAENHSLVKVREEIDYVFKVLESLTDKRIVKIFRMKYLDGLPGGKKMTWKKIAASFDLTPQTIINLHQKGRKAIKRKANSTRF